MTEGPHQLPGAALPLSVLCGAKLKRWSHPRWSKPATVPLQSDNETWITSFLENQRKSLEDHKDKCFAPSRKRVG